MTSGGDLAGRGSQRRLAFVIPAYNEAVTIASVLDSLPGTTPDVLIEKVVVDDHSQDATAALARSEGATVINHLFNAGSGAATATGLAYARQQGFHYAVTVDADGQHTGEDCRRVMEAILDDDADLVIGSRLIDVDGMPPSRVFGNRALSFFTAALFGVRITDSQSGLKGFSRRALETIEIRSPGYEFCSEIIWRAKQQRLVVREVPIRAVYTEYSLAKGQRSSNGSVIVRNLVKRKMMEFLDA